MIKIIMLFAFVMALFPVVSAVAAEKLPVTTDEARDAQYLYIQPDADKKLPDAISCDAQKDVQAIAPAAGQEEEDSSQGSQAPKASQKYQPLTTDEARGATY